MRVGIDVFTIRELNLTPMQQADYIKSRGFEGMQYGGIRGMSETLDAGELKDIRAYADSLGLYSYVSVSAVNPIISGIAFDDLKVKLEEEIAAAAKAGWHELHSVMCFDSDNRYNSEIPWDRHIDTVAKMINQLRPTLEKYGSRINLEDHSDATLDLVQVIEKTDTHICGICLDTANVLCNAEDPVTAVKRVAPYTHLTHTKDAILRFNDTGVTRQTKAPGQGCIPFETILPILGRYTPELPLSIEDHKWLFSFDVFEPEFHEQFPTMTRIEFARFMKLAWQCQKKLDAGEWPPFEEYEKTPYMDEMEQRLAAGRDYLIPLLEKLNLHG